MYVCVWGAEGGASIVPIFAQEMGFTEQSWRQWARQQVEASFHVYVHVDHKSRWKQGFAIATCPLVLFMHITNPSMHIGQPPLQTPLLGPLLPSWACCMCAHAMVCDPAATCCSPHLQLVIFCCLAVVSECHMNELHSRVS